MPRLPDIDEKQLTPEQRRIYDQVKRVRGHVRGPFAIWLRNPELAECCLKLQDMFASRVRLERRLVQLMILVSARLANGAHRISRARTSAWSTTSRSSSIPRAHCPSRPTPAEWPCSERKRWSNSSPGSVSTSWWR